MCVALALGLLAATFEAYSRRIRGPDAPYDLLLPWAAARALVAGQNPWDVIGPGRSVDPGGGLMYPGTAAVTLLPLAKLSLRDASTAWVGLGAAALGFALSAGPWWRFIGLLSWPMLLAVVLPQWSPILTAAACLPAFAGLLAAKPTVGVALAAYRLDRRWWIGAVAGGTLLLAVSLVLVPSWPWDWWRALHEPAPRAAGSPDVRGYYYAPVLAPFGFLLLAALARWRRPEARLVGALACVPHVTMGYEYLAVLLLVPGSRMEACVLALLSWAYAFSYVTWAQAGNVSDTFRNARWMAITFVFVPAVLMILRRPNEGAVPAWLDGIASRISERLAALARRARTARPR